jgi:energy-coupling factor transporter ATP-binding protein EcfA2
VIEPVVAVALAAAVTGAIRYALTRAEARANVRLTFPRNMRVEHTVAALRALTGLLPARWRRVFGVPAVTLDVIATAGGIEHFLTVPAARREFVLGALRAAIPGLRVDEGVERPPTRHTLARELRCVGSGPLRTKAAVASSANLLAALQPLAGREVAVIQYGISPLGSRLLPALRSLVSRLCDTADEQADPQAEPDLAVALRVGITAERESRTDQLMARLLGAFHAAGTAEAHLVRRLLPSWVVATRIERGAPPDRGASVLAADELAAVLGVPLESPQLPGLTLAGARELPPVARVRREGLTLGDSTVAGNVRPVAVAFDEARRGLHVCAPTGAGKSTLLLNLACQLMAAGQGLVLIDSKGDLAADIIDRVPKNRRDDVIVFDPADSERPVGFNLIGGAEEADLIVDHVVGQFRARYGAAGLGPRSEDILRAALLTLATEPGFTLCEVEPLLANAAFRQRLVGRLEEPVLEGFWAWFGSLSEAARAEAIAPLANKLRTYTLRRRVRAVIGQSAGLDLAKVLAERRILLVSLAKGLVGEDAAALIGSAMTARLWAVIQGRAAVPQSERAPFTVICDEFQDFAALPLSFADAIAQSRGYAVSWVLAHQHLAQLDTTSRQAVLANCRSRVVMQTNAADAAAFAREFAPHVEAADLQGLGPFEGYAAISVGASVAPPASIRTRPMPPGLGSAEALRLVSRQRYGMAPADVDRAIRSRVIGRRPASPVGGVRREE